MSKTDLKMLEIARETQKWTVFSILIIVVIFALDKINDYKIGKENEKLLAESLMIENNRNLKVIEGFNSIKDSISQTDAVPVSRFSTVIIEEVIKTPNFGIEEVGLINPSDWTVHKTKMKVVLRDAYSQMSIINSMLDNLGNYVSVNDTIQTYESFVKQKARDINITAKEIDNLEVNLNSLNKFLTDIYNVTINEPFE